MEHTTGFTVTVIPTPKRITGYAWIPTFSHRAENASISSLHKHKTKGADSRGTRNIKQYEKGDKSMYINQEETVFACFEENSIALTKKRGNCSRKFITNDIELAKKWASLALARANEDNYYPDKSCS